MYIFIYLFIAAGSGGSTRTTTTTIPTSWCLCTHSLTQSKAGQPPLPAGLAATLKPTQTEGWIIVQTLSLMRTQLLIVLVCWGGGASLLGSVFIVIVQFCMVTWRSWMEPVLGFWRYMVLLCLLAVCVAPYAHHVLPMQA